MKQECPVLQIKFIMKRAIFITFTFLLAVAVNGQSGDITSMWPYMYKDFTQGTVYFDDGAEKEFLVNIHLLNSSLHYLDGEIIRQAKTSEVVMLRVGQDLYFMRDKKLMRVLKGDSKGFIAELTTVNLSRTNEGGGAYGSSDNVQATQRLTSLDGGAAISVNHMELKGKKEEGQLLAAKSTYYIVTTDKVYPANRKAVQNMIPEGKKNEFKSFLKKNKIKWKNIESLSLLLNYLNEI